MQTPVASSIAPLLFCLGLSTPSSSYLLPDLLSGPMPALLYRPVCTLLSCSVLVLLYFVYTPTAGSLVPTSVSCSGTSTILSFCLVLGITPTYLTSLAFRTFKWILSDKALRPHLTSPTEFLYPFLIHGALPKKSKCKRLFDIVFINSCLLTSNHAAKRLI